MLKGHLPAPSVAVERPAIGLKLPLDVRGTAFQQRVWKALQEIVPGRTTTYQGLADAIGAPSAVRAEGGGCPTHTRDDGLTCGHARAPIRVRSTVRDRRARALVA